MNAQVAVVGATGAVGREVLAVLAEAGHPASRVAALASERSEGEELDYGSESLGVERAEPNSFRGISLALFATPQEVAGKLAVSAREQGALVVDVSSAFRGKAPLLLPGVNDAVAGRPIPGRILRVPRASSAALFLSASPLREAFGLRSAEVTALLSASRNGRRGVEELGKQAADLLSGREVELGPNLHRVAFNLVPQAGAFEGERTEEEAGWEEDSKELWDGPPSVSGTALMAPIFYGMLLVVVAELARPASAEEVRSAFRSKKALKLLDEPGQRIYPMPMLVAGDSAVHVGRVRVATDKARLSFVVAADNARLAANNAVRAGALLLADKMAAPPLSP